MEDIIPHPEYKSWMHKRVHVKHTTQKELSKAWSEQPVFVQALDAVLSRIMKFYRLLEPGVKPTTFKFVAKMFRFYFKIFNQLKIIGRKNVPRTGCIFIVNHPGSYDPPILIASLPNIQIGAYVIWGQGWFSSAIQKHFGYVTGRWKEPASHTVERMVRQMLTGNVYFAMWPEGHPHMGPIEQGFSGIVKVYSVVNHDRDRIPFLPVLIRGEGTLRYGVKHKNGPIEIRFYKPMFIDRDWLKPPEEGGKGHRFIIDHVMRFLARKNGQEDFAPNPRLEGRKRFYTYKDRIQVFLDEITPIPGIDITTCSICCQLPPKIASKPIEFTERPTGFNLLEDLVEDPSNIHELKQCPECNSLYGLATRDGRTKAYHFTRIKHVRWSIYHLLADHGGKWLKSSKTIESSPTQS